MRIRHSGSLTWDPTRTSRFMFAASLADKDGYAARVCEQAGMRSKLLFVLMIAASKKSPPSSFGLNAEACERIVIPVIETARKMTTADRLITERDLFRAFCEEAGPGLKPPIITDESEADHR